MPGILSSIFGTHNKEYTLEILGIPKNIRKMVGFFAELEDESRAKIKLAQSFADTYNEADLLALKKRMKSVLSYAKDAKKRIAELRALLDSENAELVRALDLTNKSLPQFEKNLSTERLQQDVQGQLAMLRQLLALDEGILDKQAAFFAKNKDSIWKAHNNLRELFGLLQQEATILGQDEALLSKIKEEMARLGQQTPLLSPNQLIEKLYAQILESKIAERILQARASIRIAEELILREQYKNPIVRQAFVELSKGDFMQAISDMRKYVPHMQRILHVIQDRILPGLKDPEQQRKATALLQILGRAYDDEFLKKWLVYATGIMACASSGNTRQFLTYAQVERQYILPLSDRLKAIGAPGILDDVIHDASDVYYIDTLTEDSHRKWIKKREKLVRQNVLIDAFLLEPARISVQKPTSIYDFRLSPEEAVKHAYIEEDAKPLAKELVDRYRFELHGSVKKKQLEWLKKALKRHYVFEVKRFLKEIDVYSNESFVAGTASLRGGILTITGSADYETIEHELAHLRDFSMPAGLDFAWRELYDKSLKIWDSKEHEEHHSYSRPRFGFARAYGTGNYMEDIATMTELITVFRTRDKGEFDLTLTQDMGMDADDAPWVAPYADIYRKKAQLLYTFGIIPKEDFDRFISELQKLVDAYAQAQNADTIKSQAA